MSESTYLPIKINVMINIQHLLMSTFFAIIFLPYLVRCETRKSTKHSQEQSKKLSVSSHYPLLSQSLLVLYRRSQAKSLRMCARVRMCAYIHIYIYLCVYILYILRCEYVSMCVCVCVCVVDIVVCMHAADDSPIHCGIILSWIQFLLPRPQSRFC